jgi:hypothetical protein
MNRYLVFLLALKVRDLSFVENRSPVPSPAVLSLKSRRIPVGPFAPPALPGFIATTGLSDSRGVIWAVLPLWKTWRLILKDEKHCGSPEFLTRPCDTSPRSSTPPVSPLPRISGKGSAACDAVPMSRHLALVSFRGSVPSLALRLGILLPLASQIRLPYTAQSSLSRWSLLLSSNRTFTGWISQASLGTRDTIRTFRNFGTDGGLWGSRPKLLERTARVAAT